MAAAVETGHQDMVHDVQPDYYGRRVATCSSDHTIKIFDMAGDQLTHVSDLIGHQGPVFEVAWAHPKFGNILASCGFDNNIIFWQEQEANQWAPVYTSQLHTASVNSLSFAPHEVGLILASASSDGSIGIISMTEDNQFQEERIEDAHPIGGTGVSWSPAASPGALVSAKGSAAAEKRLVSCGCDKTVKVWRWSQQRGWAQEGQSLLGHKDWVRDVAWAPSLGLPMNTIASASQDGAVIIWCEENPGTWEPTFLPDFQGPVQCAVFRVSWSVTGNILAVSDSKNNVTLWKEGVDKKWQRLEA